MIYDYKVKNRDGSLLDLASLKGKVLIIVNTATGCGFTPQYEGLEALYAKYHEKGLEILDFPCNQFGHQAPGNDDEIHSFCTAKYNTHFDQLTKIEVNGENELPLYTYLKAQKGFEGFGEHKLSKLLSDMLAKVDENWATKPDIKWNFTKFVVDREGNVTSRLEPTADLVEMEAKIKEVI